MGLLLEAAVAWNRLRDCSYELMLGRKSRSQRLLMQFRPEDFDHLSGMQYAADVDFHLHRNQFRGAKLLPALLSGKLSDGLVEKSCNWEKIRDRLTILTELEAILDSDFEIYQFEPYKLPFHSEIRASFCIYSEERGKGLFLLLDGSEQVYCKSVFSKDDLRDYRMGQARWTILEKTKHSDGEKVILYRHQSYRETITI